MTKLTLAWVTTIILGIQAAQTFPAEPPPLEILSYKIGSDYYPLMERGSGIAPPMAADNTSYPQPQVERAVRTAGRTPDRRLDPAPDPRAKPKFRARIIDQADWVRLVVRNTATKPIKAVAWDFTFLRLENNQMAPRYSVVSRIEIKPGAKKTLQQKLPSGAKRCEIVAVSEDTAQPAFEAVCGAGFNDPSQLKEQQTVTINRIEYADGTVWQRQQ
jgi:hypothetical protein